jgi:hypothetical protein
MDFSLVPAIFSSVVGHHFGVVFGDLAPFVGGLEIEGVAVGEAEEGWSAPFGVAGAALLGHFDEAEGDEFADGGCDCVVMQAVFDELYVGDREPAIVLAAVVGVFDLDAIERLTCGSAERLEGGGFHHFDGSYGEASNGVLADLAHAAALLRLA